ncbi:hypothetical protein PPAR_b0571 [Pseudoalteromonas paragorgicola KMM 3548]|nr:hypothetical protein [Pseudoalteromonas distincta KMM 3548]
MHTKKACQSFNLLKKTIEVFKESNNAAHKKTSHRGKG